jgi:methylmalonyl-CoA/ethylmalonyl-CoA epimerase
VEKAYSDCVLKVGGIEHVAWAVNDVDAALAKLREVFGLEPTHREVVESQKTEAVLLPLGESNLELIAPKGNESLARFLEKRGQALHHVALKVADLPAALDELRAAGVRLIDETPRIGARGHRVAFVHPQATAGLLVELVEIPGDDR